MTTSLTQLKLDSLDAPLHRLLLPIVNSFDIQLDLLRLDLIHPQISGNKWFKLLPQLETLDLSYPVLSFGGPHSNHLHALGWASHRLGFKVIAIIRGDPCDTPTLADLRRWDVDVHFVSRETYRTQTEPSFLSALVDQFGAHTLIPEGGSNRAAAAACADIWSIRSLAENPPDYLVSAVGSGGTLAGLISGAPRSVEVQGVSVLSNIFDLQDRVTDLINTSADKPVSIETALPLRYGKVNSELCALAEQFRAITGIELDAIYTIRVLHYLVRKILAGRFPRGARIVMVHTGGIQGNRAQSSRVSRLASAFCGPLPL